MRAVLDALSLSIVLLAIPWITIQIGVGAALAWRQGMEPWIGAALGLIPIPFAGWIVIAVMASGGYEATNDHLRPFEVRGGLAGALTDDDVK